jgi:hypothetical protein
MIKKKPRRVTSNDNRKKLFNQLRNIDNIFGKSGDSLLGLPKNTTQTISRQLFSNSSTSVRNNNENPVFNVFKPSQKQFFADMAGLLSKISRRYL